MMIHRAILRVMINDRGKCVSSQPITLWLNPNKSFRSIAERHYAEAIHQMVPATFQPHIPIEVWCKVIHLCFMFGDSLPHRVTHHDRYDIHYQFLL